VKLAIAIFAFAAAFAANAETAAPAEAATAAPAEAAVSSPDGRTALDLDSRAKAGEKRTVKVTSDRATYLRKDGVLAFEGNVCVDDVEFKMHAKEVNIFLEGTNELKRVVAIGDVAVTNGFRYGTCAKATYNKALSKVVLYGDEAKGILAKLCDAGKRRSEVEGRKITFWVDTEQVEVEGSTVTVDAGGLGDKGSAKRFLGR